MAAGLDISPSNVGESVAVYSRRTLRKVLKRLVSISLAILLIPKLLAFYLVCGIIDVARNRKPTLPMLERYFLGNGLLTWLLSPFNLLMDLLTVPYKNKGVYTLSDLPKSYQEEIEALITAARGSNLVETLRSRVGEQERAMIFFQWYGKNLETSIDVSEFRRRYKHIRTIGVSVFNKRQETSEHFGPLRVTLRMLYNLNAIEDRGAYVEVGNHLHRWCDEKLLIFDDTLMHKSCNETDSMRYCLFVDMLRPSLFPSLMNAILVGVGLVARRFNFVFYKNWAFIT